MEKPLKTIIAYGDSWTYGSCADGWKEALEAGCDRSLILGSWVNQLKRFLESHHPDTCLRNHGTGGWKGSQGLENYDQMVGAFKPDLLLLNFGINDWKNGVPLEEFRQAMGQIISKTASLGSACILWTSGPVSSARGESYGYGNPIQDEALIHQFEEFNDTLRSLAHLHQIKLLDVAGMIKDEWRNTDSSVWFTDAIHFNQKGHDMIYRCMKKAVLEEINLSIKR